MKTKKVTIVVPVYADWPSLKDCIQSLMQYVDAKHNVMLVNDCGPEADLLEKNIKEAIKGSKNFYYYRNPKNLGFVKTCNRAILKLDKTDNDILLLNSDTEVTAGFLEEILDLLSINTKIGAISPRTNNATIFTLPLAAISQKGIEARKSYELFRKYKAKFPRYSEVPTAHGFCMLIRRGLIKKYGLFDEAFGMGYGEEVDFCQRVAKHGWLNVVSHQAYVFHLEAKSFSLETKKQLIEQSSKIILQRYPTYKRAVSEYIEKAMDQERKILGNDAKIGHRHHSKMYKFARAVKRALIPS
ncbi:MAG TPA: glycosyltransferase family 2 protein [Candidatus Saccharimonadales bacterium]|nr:glycosyltransferase family 2 protein [Candidatus Saccharimonadales bacterium]